MAASRTRIAERARARTHTEQAMRSLDMRDEIDPPHIEEVNSGCRYSDPHMKWHTRSDAYDNDLTATATAMTA